jgi:hypothetical protein
VVLFSHIFLLSVDGERVRLGQFCGFGRREEDHRIASLESLDSSQILQI